MALDPIRLGSAALTTLVFESGSSITTSDSGIQSCSVKALCGDGSAVFGAIPAAGVGFNAVFGNSYLPSTFLVDYTGGGPDIEYLEGRVARITISFKRQDPAQLGVRKIFVDSVINYDSPLSNQSTLVYGLGGGTEFATPFTALGFPEPVVTVKYNSNTRPGIGTGGLTQLYAAPGSANASGFPATPSILLPVSIPLGVGATVSYFDGTAFVTVGPTTAPSTINFVIDYRPNPLGWQLVRLKSDPVAAATFYDIEEEWRTSYNLFSANFVSIVPPP